MLGDRRKGGRVKSSKLWPRNQTMTSPKGPMRLSQFRKQDHSAETVCEVIAVLTADVSFAFEMAAKSGYTGVFCM